MNIYSALMRRIFKYRFYFVKIKSYANKTNDIYGSNLVQNLEIKFPNFEFLVIKYNFR